LNIDIKQVNATFEQLDERIDFIKWQFWFETKIRCKLTFRNSFLSDISFTAKTTQVAYQSNFYSLTQKKSPSIYFIICRNNYQIRVLFFNYPKN
jgi:hypothetical protein